ncbi:hypothetical protein LSH36_985g01038 [Paralvinella palmiformis]|uniref:EGF-like domain-containing protein n=1 Tax=Paralvinella palmiformis TaxID=53620 RepID=A0AAD9MS71_9ANNE|nr:hypothetical protein LSH36_985g01038 [Paralvinella palmiformis]
MATKIISIFMVLLSFWTLVACRQGNATRIKSNTPDAPMSMIDGLAGRRIRRGTSGSQLTYQERIDFLKSHNDYRANTNPMASDMQFMVWHEELAAMAQDWADGCQWKHGNPERDPKPFPSVGQNIYATTGKSLTGKTVTTSWYNEKPYTSGTKCLNCPSDKSTCNKGMCVSDPKCGSKTCENGGTLDSESCECLCSEGYNGDNCTSAGYVKLPFGMLYIAVCMLVALITC